MQLIYGRIEKNAKVPSDLSDSSALPPAGSAAFFVKLAMPRFLCVLRGRFKKKKLLY